MKKLLTFALSAVLVLTLTITALAATVTDVTQNNSVTAEVFATINAGNNSTPVYAVDVSWDDLSFSYSYGNNWNPNDLAYNDSQAGSWQDAQGVVTVSNRSNADVVATVAFRAASGITSTFKDNKSSATLSDASVGAQATVETFVITVAGTPDLSGKRVKIGDITVSITAPAVS